MIIYEQAVQFSSFEDCDKIQHVLDSTDDQEGIYNQLFKFACMQNKFVAVQYIHQQSLINKIPLQINNGLVLSIHYLDNYLLNSHDDEFSDQKIIPYFISQGADVRFDDDKVLHLSIKHKKSFLISQLYDYCHYQEPHIISLLYKEVIEHYNFSLLNSLINDGNPHLSLHQINQLLTDFQHTNSFDIHHHDFTEFINYLLKQGGNAYLLNNSLIIPALIWNEKFSLALHLISYGIDIRHLPLNTIEFVIEDFIAHGQDCDMFKVYQSFKEYAKNNNIQFNYLIDSMESLTK